MKHFHERLEEAIHRKKVIQKDLARRLGISQPSLSRIINKKQYMDFHLAVKTSEILGVSLNWLAYGEEKPKLEKDPRRQRIEYLLSILEENKYSILIQTLEGLVELQVEEDEEGGSREPGLNKSPESRPLIKKKKHR